MYSKRLILLTAFSIALASGCSRLSNKSTVYRTSEKSAITEGVAAQQHEAAIELINCGAYDAAEQKLQSALVSDVDYGPAHNTLGKLYYDQQKFYWASWEFEHAAKAMPNRAEPHNNLGLVYESVEKQDRAIEAYEVAVSLDPQNSVYLGNLIRAKVRRGDRTRELASLLRQFIHHDDRYDWTEWARLELIKQEGDRVGIRPEVSGATLDHSSEVVWEQEEVIEELAMSLDLEADPSQHGSSSKRSDSVEGNAISSEEIVDTQEAVVGTRRPSFLKKTEPSIFGNSQEPKLQSIVPEIESGFKAKTRQKPGQLPNNNVIRLIPDI